MNPCPQCKHPMSDFGTANLCTFCGFQQKKNIAVYGKEFDPFDYHALGDAVEWVHACLYKAVEGKTGNQVLALIMDANRQVTRLYDLRLNLISGKLAAFEALFKEYMPYVDFIKQEVERSKKG